MSGETAQPTAGRTAKGLSSLVGRKLPVGGRVAVVRLEASYWQALDEIAAREGRSTETICAEVQERLNLHWPPSAAGESRRTTSAISLSNAIRVFVVGYFRQAATEQGHDRAGHGAGDPFVSTPFGTAAVQA